VGLLTFGLAFVAACTQSTGVTGGWNQKQGWNVEGNYTITWDPPGSELADLNASQLSLPISMTNAELTSTSGTGTVTVTDLSTGNVVGQQSFGYTVSGSTLYVQDPTAVQNWLDQFTSYTEVEVGVAINSLAGQDTATSGTGTATGTAVYQGTTYASQYSSWNIGGGSGKPCNPSPCTLGPSK
jgi:hypothetical protein